MKHRRPITLPPFSSSDWSSQARCRCEKPGYCPRHDPLTYSGDARHLKGL